MVMDNDEARRRHGVQPTYKGEKGFARKISRARDYQCFRL